MICPVEIASEMSTWGTVKVGGHARHGLLHTRCDSQPICATALVQKIKVGPSSEERKVCRNDSGKGSGFCGVGYLRVDTASAAGYKRSLDVVEFLDGGR